MDGANSVWYDRTNTFMDEVSSVGTTGQAAYGWGEYF